jgi:nucleoside-diphosphate-sugar epimerase
MRLFVTGASGWIGSAVVAELLAHDHQVLGLARSDASAEAIAAAGAEVRRGEITDLAILRAATEECDGVVHLAFRHDVAFSGDFETAVASDRAAIEAIGDALAGTNKPLAIASGLAGLRSGRIATEDDRPEPTPGAGGRITNERTALALGERGVRSMSIRFAPTVHGAGDHGFIARIVAADVEHGAAAYVGDGENRWSAVHVTDAARLVRLGIERAPAGTVLHAAAEEGIAFRQIAEAIGRRLGLPTKSLPADHAPQHFGFLGAFVGMDAPASSVQTRELLGWEPARPGLVADITAGAYDPALVA